MGLKLIEIVLNVYPNGTGRLVESSFIAIEKALFSTSTIYGRL